MTGKYVYYNSEIYTVVHDYGNGWVEIRKPDSYVVHLVEKDKLTLKGDENGVN